MFQHERDRQAVKFQSEIAEIASGIVADARAHGFNAFLTAASAAVAEFGDADLPDDVRSAVVARVAFMLQQTD